MNLQDVYITRKMRFNKIVKVLPQAIDVFNKRKLKCLKCCSLPADPVEDVLRKEGLSDQEIDEVITEINSLKTELVHQGLQKPREAEFQLEEIQEANKKYYQIAGLLITENAYQNIHSLSTDNALRINLEAGGCSGYKYKFEYCQEPAEGEHSFSLSDKLQLFLDDFTFAKLHGSVVDFKISLHDSGLKIINPNLKGSCSCGVSVSF